MSTELVTAAALMLVFQGLQCLFGPSMMRAIWLQLAAQPDVTLRFIGAAITAVGVSLGLSAM